MNSVNTKYKSSRVKRKKPLSLTEDWVFKHVFCNPFNLEILKFLLQAIHPQLVIKKIVLFPNEETVNFEDQKANRYDACGLINDHLMFNVEMQRSGNRTLQGIRIAFYASRLFSSQPIRGVDFSKLKPIWVLMIADFPFFDDPDQYFEDYSFVGSRNAKSLTEYIQLSVVEVDRAERLAKKPTEQLTASERWVVVLKYAGDPSKRAWIRKIMELDEGCRKAVERMEQYFNGERKGFQQGILINKVHLIRKKAAKGKTAEAIAEDLEEEITLIKKILKIIQAHPNFSDSQIAKQLTKNKRSKKKDNAVRLIYP
ncbi:MAG: PD-(D/E)XK nuclease family transposase [Holdemania massiliensis]